MARDCLPEALQPGQWIVWHELKPPVYRVLESLDDGILIAEREENVREHGVGNFTPTAVRVADRRFQLVDPPEWTRIPTPTTVGTTILASAPSHRGDSPVLAVLEGCHEAGLQWVEVGSGEWVDGIVDWRLVNGLDTSTPEREKRAVSRSEGPDQI